MIADLVVIRVFFRPLLQENALLNEQYNASGVAEQITCASMSILEPEKTMEKYENLNWLINRQGQTTCIEKSKRVAIWDV